MKRFKYPFSGFLRLVTKDSHYVLHLVSTVCVIIVSYFLSINMTEWLFILSAIFLVLLTEALNTAIEEVVDLVTSDFEQHAKYAKDIASFAVLLSSIYAALIGVIILLPKLLKLIGVL